MAYRRRRSPVVDGTLVGIGIWLAGYLVAVAALLFAPIPGSDFSLWSFAATLTAAGTASVLLLLIGASTPLAWLVPSLAVLLVTVAGGAIVTERTERTDAAWPAIKAGASVCLGLSLTTLTVMAVYLVPSTPVSNTPVSFRYVMLLFGNLLVPGLFGALGGSIQYTLAARHDR